MSEFLNRHPSLLFLIVFLAFGIVGTMDFQDAQFAEKTLCERHPQPEWCRK